MKKSLISLSSLALMLMLILVSAGDLFAQVPAGSPVDRHGQLKVVGNQILDKNNEPVQLRGMSYFWSMAGEASLYYNEDVVKWLASDWKISVIRAAMGISETWGVGGAAVGYLGAGANAKENEKARIERVITGAIEAGIYVIIDWHSHTAHTQTEESLEFFREMADTYKDYPNIIYEIYNEPIGSAANPQANWQLIKPYTQTLIDAIRAIDPYNIIIIGTPFYCQRPDVAAADPVIGEHLAYSMHFYSASHRDDIRSHTYRTLSMGKAVFVSEFGVCNANGNTPYDFVEADKWMAFMDEHKLSWANWSISNKAEAASALTSTRPVPSATGGWNPETELTESGKYIRNKLLNPPSTEKLFHYINVKIEGQGTVRPLYIRTNPTTGAPIETDALFAYQKTMDTTFTLRAIPASGGWTFAGWEGDLTGDENDSRIRTNRDWTITAKFTHPTLSAFPTSARSNAAQWSIRRVNGGVSLSGPSAGNVTLYDIRGKVAGRFSYSGGALTINKSNIAAGSYFMTVRDKTSGREVYRARVSMVN